MKLLRLVQLAALLGPALALAQGVASPAECADAFEDCKEDCAMEFGTSLTTREQFARCLGRCTRTHSDCKERYFDVTSNKLDDDALSKKRTRFADEPAPRRGPEVEPDRGEEPAPKRPPPDEPTARSDPAEAAPSAASGAQLDEPVRRTATRMSDLEKAAPPAAHNEENVAEDKALPVDESKTEEEPAPADAPPKKKEAPKPPPQKTKPPEKKRALDEWDPDAF